MQDFEVVEAPKHVPQCSRTLIADWLRDGVGRATRVKKLQGVEVRFRANEEIGEAKQLQRCGGIACFKHGWFTEVVELTRTELDGGHVGISNGG